MTIEVQAFNPILNYTIAGTNTATSQAIAQPLNNSPAGYANSAGYRKLRIINGAASTCFVAWSMGTATASTSGNYPILGSSTSPVLDMGMPATSVSVILGSATTGTVYIAIGDGGA